MNAFHKPCHSIHLVVNQELKIIIKIKSATHTVLIQCIVKYYVYCFKTMQ